MEPPRPVKNSLRGSLDRFLQNPASVRYAAMAIITVTVVIVLAGAAVLRVFDHREYPTFGGALWFSLQTVTTVGYGDNTPQEKIGRVVATAIMLTSIGLITMVTAIITSTFVAAARARAEHEAETNPGAADGLSGVHVRLDTIADRLERLEGRLAASDQPDAGRDLPQPGGESTDSGALDG